jgi:CarboxypepD_reg-like domain
MKCKLTFVLLLLFHFSNAQYKIQGRVIDSETQKPLEGVNVFLSHTTIGTTTNDKGEFQLNHLEPGKYELVVTSINYENYTQLIQENESAETLIIKLKPAVITLKEVVVEQFDKDGWDKWKDSFDAYFIGSAQQQKNCVLINPEVVKFSYNSKTNRLRAVATDKLIFENKDLGYRIIYLLSKFEIDFSNKTFSFTGYPLLEELSPKNAKEMTNWNKLRDETYKGSLRHFIRSLYMNQLEKNGYELRKVKFITRQEQNRVKDTLKQINKTKQKSETNNIPIGNDSMDYYLHVKNLAFDNKKLTFNNLVPEDSILFNNNSGQDSKLFYFTDYLQVKYLKKRNPFEYAKTLPKYRSNEFIQTEINLRFGTPVHIYQNGNYYNGLDLLIDGYWAWFEKVSTMLPTDYTPIK